MEFEVAGAPLGTGGEANVFAVPGQPGVVAKVYHKPTAEHAEKLTAMLAAPPDDPMAKSGHASIAWPTARLVTADDAGRFAGFLMPRIDQARHVNEYYIPKSRQQQCPLFHYGYLMRTARNLAAAVRAVHDRGYVIGDLSGANVLVTGQALVTLIDTDSFQVRAADRIFRCRVATPEYTPPELQAVRFTEVNRLPEHDAFGLAVLIFQLLMQGTHPFAGLYSEEGDPAPIPKRIARGHWPYAREKAVPYRPNPHAPPWEGLPPMVQALFLLCFEDGHKEPSVRPTALDWQQGLADAEKELQPCAANAQHVYYRGLTECPWCALGRQQRRDPFPSVQALRSASSAATGILAAPKATVVLEAVPADAPARPVIALPPRPRAVDLVRPAIWIAAAFAFLITATVVAWGAWKLTHPRRPGDERPTEVVVRRDTAPRQSGNKGADVPEGPVQPPPMEDPPEPPPDEKPPETPAEPAPFAEHPSITALAISDDGRRVLSGSNDGIARLWDLTSGRLVRRLEGHTKPITAVAFAPDGRQAVTASEDTTLRLWDTTDGRELHVFKPQVVSRAVVFTPDGRTFISAGPDGSWRTWDTVLGRARQRVAAHILGIRCLALSSDGRRLATGGNDGSMLVWDVATAAKQLDVNKHPGGVHALAFAADNRHLLSAGADNTVRLWDVDNVWEDRHFDKLPRCIGLSFVAGGKRALVTLRDSVRLIDVKTGEEIASLRGPKHGSGVASVVTPDEQWVMIAGDDRFLHRRPVPKPGDNLAGAAAPVARGDSPLLEKTPLPTGELLKLEGHEKALRFAQLLPDGQRAVSGGEDGWIAVWDLATGKVKQRLKGHEAAVVGMAVSSDGRRAISGATDGSVILWDLDEGSALQTLMTKDPVHAVAITPDGKRFLAGLASGAVRAWSEDGQQIWATGEGRRPVVALAASADGKQFIEVRNDGVLAIVDVASGKVVEAPQRRALPVIRARFLPDLSRGVLSVRVPRSPLVLWDREGKPEIAFGGRTVGISSLAIANDGRFCLIGNLLGKVAVVDLSSRDSSTVFDGQAQVDIGLSADGRYAIAASNDNVVRIWDLKALPGAMAKEPAAVGGKEKNCFRGHDGPVDAVAIGPEGRYLLSASAADRSVRQWDIATGAMKRSYLSFPNNMTATSLSRDGRQILTLHADWSMVLRNAENGKPSRPLNPPMMRRPGLPMSQPVTAAVLTPDGKGVYTLAPDRLTAWNISSGRPARIVSRNRDMFDVSRAFLISDNARVGLFFGPSDVMVMNLATGKEVCRVHNEREVAFFCAALSADGKMVFTSGLDGGALSDAETGKSLRKLAVDHRAFAAAFSPDGRFLLTGDRRGEVRLFKVENGEEVKAFKGHEQVVQSIAFSSDGRFAATGSADTTVRLWEMPDDVHVAQEK